MSLDIDFDRAASCTAANHRPLVVAADFRDEEGNVTAACIACRCKRHHVWLKNEWFVLPMIDVIGAFCAGALIALCVMEVIG